MRLRDLVALPLVLSLASACHRPKHYETTVEVTRSTPVRKDETGKPLTLDFEFSYSECPGTQVEVIRGDVAFAACVAKYKPGDKVKIALDHQWDPEGHWEAVVKMIGDCPRVPDPADEASFALVRECDDWNVNGTRVGFQCKYLPEQKLLEKCPWFKRH